MTESEAGRVLAEDPHPCARFYADRGGRPITADRPWALRAARVRAAAARVLASLGLAAMLGALGSRLGGCFPLGGSVCLTPDPRDPPPANAAAPREGREEPPAR